MTDHPNAAVIRSAYEAVERGEVIGRVLLDLNA